MTTLNQAAKSLNVRRGVENALNNELKTRERVDRLEREVERLKCAVSCSPGGGLHQLAVWQNTTWRVVMERGFWGRLRWLLFGKVDK